MVHGSIMLAIGLLGALASPQGGVFPQRDAVERLFNEAIFTEGPAVGADNCVYFSDQTFTADNGMLAGIIWRYNPRDGSTKVFRSPSGMANGIKFDKNGDMIVAEGADHGGQRLTRTDMKTGKARIIVAEFNSHHFNSPNDLAIDGAGTIYFTDPRYVGNEPVEQPVMGVYQVRADGEVSLLIGDIPMPNGIALSPDGKTMYVGCNDEGLAATSLNSGRAAKMCVFEYSLLPNGRAQQKGTLVDYGNAGGPDGIAVDRDGNVYVAVRDEARPGIRVYDPSGKQIDEVRTPEVPSNLAFGRGELKGYLFITAGKSLYRVRVLKEGCLP